MQRVGAEQLGDIKREKGNVFSITYGPILPKSVNKSYESVLLCSEIQPPDTLKSALVNGRILL